MEKSPILQLNLCKMATLKKTTNGFQDQLLLNAGQKYCGMLQGEHSPILLTFIKLPFSIKIFVLYIVSGRLRQVLLYIRGVIRNFAEKCY